MAAWRETSKSIAEIRKPVDPTRRNSSSSATVGRPLTLPEGAPAMLDPTWTPERGYSHAENLMRGTR